MIFRRSMLLAALVACGIVLGFLAEGNEVAVRLTARGTNLGPIGGVIPPTGREFVASQSHWFRVEDGKLAEHWAVRDDLSAMLQLGVIQPPRSPDEGAQEAP